MGIAEPNRFESEGKRPGQGKARGIWNRLTDPAKIVRTREGQRQARLLSAMLLTLTVVTALGVVTFSGSSLGEGVDFITKLSTIGLFAVAYGISRTKHVRLAAAIAVGTFAILPVAVYIGRGDTSYVATANTLIWTILALLVGNVFLTAQSVVVLVLSLTLGLGALPLIRPDITYQNLFLVMMLDLVVAAIVLMGRRLRDLVEQDRRYELSEANRKLETLSLSLEGRFADRTRELALAADVGHAISQVRDLDALLADAVELIRNRFDLYHVQVYLADESESILTLKSGTGLAGKSLVGQQHRLQFGPGSINGLAAASRHAIVVANTADSPLFLSNALLPETRSEMAVPLVIGSLVLGVLDLQSRKPNGLTEKHLPAFEALAGQLAVAIENSKLFMEINQARAELETRTADQAYAAWHDFMDAIHRRSWIGYDFIPADNIAKPLTEPLSATTDELCMATPITVRGEAVGAIHLEREPSESWTHQEVEIVTLISRQVAQKVENLRLLAEAEQYRREAEDAARRLTRQGWEDHMGSVPGGRLGYAFDHTEVIPVSAPPDGDTDLAITEPLAVGNETIGHLRVESPHGDAVEASELVATVARRLSAHFENMRLSARTEQALATSEQHARQLVILNELSEALNRAPGLDDVFKIGVEYVGRILAPDRVSLTMIAAPRSEVEIMAIYGETGNMNVGDRVPVDEGSTFAQVIATKHLIYVSDSDGGAPGGIRSFVMAPLMDEEGVIGTVNIGSKVPHAYKESDESLFMQLAATLGSSIARRQLAERMAKRAAEMETVAQLSSATASALETGKLLQDVVDLTKASFGLYHAHIYLLDQTKTNLVLCAGAGEVGRQMVAERRTIPLRKLRSLVARAARSRQAVVANDVRTEPDFLPHPLLPGTRSELAVPLITGDQVLGVLDVQSEKPHRFTSEDVHIQTTLASQVAVAVQRARLLENTSRRARHEQILREITAKVSHSASVDSVMRAAVEELGRALGRRAFVYLGDQSESEELESKNGANHVYGK